MMETLQAKPEMTKAERVDLARAEIDRAFEVQQEQESLDTIATTVRGIGAISNESATTASPDMVVPTQATTTATERMIAPDYMRQVVYMGQLIIAHRTRNSQD